MSASRRVYSTDAGPTCPRCHRLLTACRCKRKAPRNPLGDAPRDGVVRVGRQTKGRKGQGVTIVTGVPLAGAALEQLARSLKATCGAGGTVRDGTIEIQGEHRARLVPLLEARGWRVKRVGG